MENKNKLEKEKERLKRIPFINKGNFDYREVDEGDCSLIRPCIAAIEERSKEEHPKIFTSQCNFLKNVPGTKTGRVWIAIKGNISACIAFPREYFSNSIIYEFFPFIGPVAIRDTFNYFAPGEYLTKYPNDIVCKSHWRKTCGIIFRNKGKYTFVTFGVDLIDHPSDEEIREFGVKACCMKKHTENVPTPEQFLCVCTKKMIEMINNYTTIDKIVKLINESYSAYGRKTLWVEINNKNADPSVDGAMYCPDCPNAMLKGYVNGILYEIDGNIYDDNLEYNVYDETMKKYDMMFNIQMKEDFIIQQELEEKKKDN